MRKDTGLRCVPLVFGRLRLVGSKANMEILLAALDAARGNENQIQKLGVGEPMAVLRYKVFCALASPGWACLSHVTCMYPYKIICGT